MSRNELCDLIDKDSKQITELKGDLNYLREHHKRQHHGNDPKVKGGDT